MALNINGTTGISGVDGSASAPALQGTDSNTGINFGTDTVNINTGGTTRATVDSAGNVGIGTTSPSVPSGTALEIKGSSVSRLKLSNDTTGTGSLDGFQIYTSGSTAILENKENAEMRFYTNSSEKMRILSTGALCIGRTTETVDHNNFGTSIGAMLSHSRAITAASPSVAFYGAQGYAQVMGDGDLENTHGRYGSLSDQTLKENIVDANSQWNDIKNIKIRNFNFKESTGYATHKQIGVVAQELETVCPNLVDENDQGIKAVASSVLYMKAVKALQEAQARIETLEAEKAQMQTDLTALTARVTALEAG